MLLGCFDIRNKYISQTSHEFILLLMVKYTNTDVQINVIPQLSYKKLKIW